MKWVLFLFLPFLIQAKIALAPGMYPPEEMNSEVPNVPRNPYQVMDENTPQAYQFYYEKDDDEPSPPEIPQPPPLPISISPPSPSQSSSSSASSSGSPASSSASPASSSASSASSSASPASSSASPTSSSASSPPASHLLSPSETSSEGNATPELFTYESLEPEQKKTSRKFTTKMSSSSVIEFTTSSPRTTARVSEHNSNNINNLKPHGSTVVFASDEEEPDPRRKVEQLIQEEHKGQEAPMTTGKESDQEYGENGESYKEPNNGNPLDYRPIPNHADQKKPNKVGQPHEAQWGTNSGTIHSGEQPPVFHEKAGSQEEYEQPTQQSFNNNLDKNRNQLERNGGNQIKHEGQYSHQITLPPDSSRSWVYEGDPNTGGSNGRKNCCACCDDEKTNHKGMNYQGSSNTPFDSSGPNPDIGEPKPIITDQRGYQESIQSGDTVQRPFSPEIPTLAPEGPLPINDQQSNGYQPFNPARTSTFPGQQPQPQQSVPNQYTPVGTFQPLYDSPSAGCPCAASPPQTCCQPITPCCLPTIPCCPPPPPIPCCPQPAVCCQPPPPPCCPVQQTCCSQPVIPLCYRSCPSCPCRRRLHAYLRMKRSSGAGCQSHCTANGQTLPGRVKRQSPGCKSCNSTPNPLTALFGQLNTGCGTCSGSHRRVKRLGCLPCLGRKKRDIDAEHHRRVKRLGCLPCLGKRKKRSLGNCHSCSNLGSILHRAKRTICSPCGKRKKRETEEKELRRAPCPCQANRGATSYQSSYSLARTKRETDESFDSVFTCDKSCCDYDKCDKIRAKRLDLN